ncbi:MAG: deoxyribonuclease IV [Deltaproteobacteria bacterium]|jgi:deoxyribonuclease-4|nr:deoxyribonuclease IV [Deltaproteobacteria bacterium]
MHLGCHLSTSKGWLNLGTQAALLGADTFQFFSRNPRGGGAKEPDPEDAAALTAFLKENDFGPVIAHAPYTLNPCSSDPRIRNFAKLALTEDLTRLSTLPGALYNLHPGSHVGQGAEKGIALAAELMNEVMAEILSDDSPNMILLETMAGKGSEIGRTFEELAEIIEKVDMSSKVGVCLDTCHVFDGGYDVKGDLEGVLKQFDDILSLSRLKAVHVNDSLNPLGSRKDRHAKIGQGHIGLEALSAVVRHPKLQGLPFVLETPNDLPGYAEEIKLLRDQKSNHGPAPALGLSGKKKKGK